MSNRPTRVVTVDTAQMIEKPIPIGGKRSTRTHSLTRSHDLPVALPDSVPRSTQDKRLKVTLWTPADQALSVASKKVKVDDKRSGTACKAHKALHVSKEPPVLNITTLHDNRKAKATALAVQEAQG
jgi:hypothetical protein